MTHSLTQWLKESRLQVVHVDAAAGRIRVKSEGDACSDLSCGADAVVTSDDHGDATLQTLNPGDIIRMDTVPGRPPRVVVLRRVWEELTSPEL